jgi:hypothetical protein
MTIGKIGMGSSGLQDVADAARDTPPGAAPLAARIEKQAIQASDGRTEQIWPLPLDEALLVRFFTDVFEHHYERMAFGPLIPGAAYELKAPCKPVNIELSSGYLTIHWGTRGHFHLCVGEVRAAGGKPAPAQIVAHQRPGRAEFYRRLDRNGLPTSWGFRMFNGHGELQIMLMFPNPYVTDDDCVTEVPDWSRLATWQELLQRYTGNAPDGLDEQGRGFRDA